jgi:hypothetical protein
MAGGCTTTKVYTSASQQDVAHNGIIQQPKIAYITVDAKKKINGKSSVKAKPNICPTVDEMKEQAEYDALKTSGNDVLIEPMYKVTVVDHFFKREINVEVEGFGGKYTEFKDIKEVSKDDLEALRLYGNIVRISGANSAVRSSTGSAGSKTSSPLMKMLTGK